MPGWAMSWLPWLAVVAWVSYVLVALAGSSSLGGLCLMMQRSWLEMLMLEKTSYADRALAWFFCRAERMNYVSANKVHRGTAWNSSPGLSSVDGGAFPSKPEAFENNSFLTLID